MSNDNKNYKSNIPKVKYALTEIEMACFKEIGQLVRNVARDKCKHLTGRLFININYQIRRKEKSVRLGLKRKAFYGMYYEFGTKKGGPSGGGITKQSFLTSAVLENIDRIRLIAGKYFKEIEKENIEIGLLTNDGEKDDS